MVFWRRTRAFWTMVGLRIGEMAHPYLACGFIIGYVAVVLMVDKSVPDGGRVYRVDSGIRHYSAGGLAFRSLRSAHHLSLVLSVTDPPTPSRPLCCSTPVSRWIVIPTIITGMGSLRWVFRCPGGRALSFWRD